ncbi:MAG: phosphoribosyl-ATP diphosphatase [Spirochaetaceae bacterium]|jgi:phosphoribosyl-ATP pyrophosphohydrolase/phosphoribosyl-AMP cyclohydrolase|nr:phosphoribosyl-ATP diphosphatase [Spirochaetaceae bacterium]
MTIASIDIQEGSVVQLRQGDELVLRREDAADLARQFDRCGEVAVIDLDAAMGKGSNAGIVKSLLRLAQCRVGGGVRTVDAAVELVSLGAEKIIVGSAALRCPDRPGFAVNAAFLDQLARKIGRERLVVAVDARSRDILADGWKTATGLPLVDTARQIERYAGELLWTCVEREGTMTGIDMETLRLLRGAVSCRITVAGGVTTIEEIELLASAGCDVQLGMALYTGTISLEDAFIHSLNWAKSADKLLPVIAQSPDGQVLMTGFTDAEALARTFDSGKLCFHSRTRDKLWMKGESSGNTLGLIRLRADCDRDAILATVQPAGPVCHSGAHSCFETGPRFTIQRLQAIIEERLRTAPQGSYTASLSVDKVRRKVMEEAYELCTARTPEESVWEAADLFYHATLLLSKTDVSVERVFAELDRRHKEDGAHKKRFSL